VAQNQIRSVARESFAQGLREHLPWTVGVALRGLAETFSLALRGIVVLGLATFAHFVLGVSVPATIVGAAGGSAAIAVARIGRKWR
jgi:hypothetical protein